MDYTPEEEEIVNIFEGYLKNQEYTEAGNFIERELRKRPESVLLNYYYAKYLKDKRGETDKAIKILQELRKVSRNHPLVLRLLLNCFVNDSIPMYESADNLVNQIKAELGEYLDQEPSMQLEIARFYIRWSISMKTRKGIDPYEDNQRVAKYKELAQKALDILEPIEREFGSRNDTHIRGFRLHEVYYRVAQCYYNLWDYDEALKNINRAIVLAEKAHDKPATYEYETFKIKSILNTKDFYDRNRFLDRR